MKKLILILFLVVSIFLSCTTKCDKPEVTDVFCFLDVTDTVNFNLAAEYLSGNEPGGNSESQLWNKLNGKAYKFQKCAGGLFRLYKINDVGENKFEEIKYPKEDYFGNDKTDYQITDDPSVKAFKFGFAKIFDDITLKETKTKRSTKIFLPLCKALNQLNESNAARKILIIFSDMLEHSDKFSFYTNKEIDPAKTMDSLEDIYNQNFPALKNIEVYIVSKRNAGNDVGIDKAEKFWKTIFTGLYPAKVFKQGASLEIN